MANEFLYIPSGTKNLAALFPTVDFNNVAEYFIEVVDVNGNTIGTTPLNIIGCCCSEDKLRLHFLNYLGTFDAINFNKPIEDHESKSDTWEKPLLYPLSKSDGGIRRFNIKSNESYRAITTCYAEKNMDWIKELLDSPIAFIEWKGTQGQADDFLPIVITDKKTTTKKVEERYTYEVEIEFKMANENVTIRN